jgi:hypothetical protein
VDRDVVAVAMASVDQAEHRLCVTAQGRRRVGGFTMRQMQLRPEGQAVRPLGGVRPTLI